MLTYIIIPALIFTHFIFFLVGKSVTENRAVNKAFPDYRRMREYIIRRGLENEFEDFYKQIKEKE